MMVTMYDTDTGEQPIMRLDRDGVSALDGRPSRPADLSQLLEKEKIPIVRDPNDMTFFKGFFVYVHDQDEKTRPIIVRDYPKPPTKEEGQWPQFRLTGPGRCPFVEDYYDRRMYRAAQESRNAASRQTTATTTASTATTAPAPATANTGAGTNASTHEATITPISSVSTTAAPTTNSQSIIQPTTKKRPAEDLNPPPSQRLRRSARVQTASAAQVQTTQPNYTPSFHLTHTGGGSVGSPAPTPEPSGVPAISSRQSSGEGFPAANPARPAPPRPPARLICGEPVASGIQPSNITSAIRSQMVSSAAGIGARAGTSREVHQLQRKVLAQTTSASAGTGPSSFVNEARAAVAQAPQQPQPRAAKLKAQESLCQKQRATATQARKQSTKKKAEAEGKAGYCENCQDKFTDFKVVRLVLRLFCYIQYIFMTITNTSMFFLTACSHPQASALCARGRQLERVGFIAQYSPASAVPALISAFPWPLYSCLDALSFLLLSFFWGYFFLFFDLVEGLAHERCPICILFHSNCISLTLRLYFVSSTRFVLIAKLTRCDVDTDFEVGFCVHSSLFLAAVP